MSDEIFYATALEEYKSGDTDAGLRAKAYVAADGVENRIKIEYIKLRVTQLKGGTSGSIHSWYRNTGNGERGIYLLLSVILLMAYGIGLIPLALLIWLSLGERDELARQGSQNELERQSKEKASSTSQSARQA